MKDLRKNYTKGQLLEAEIPSSPYELFNSWFQDSLAADSIVEANAMVLSTSVDDRPDSRVVLLKDLREEEFVFYTNYESNKGRQLGLNAQCTLLFPWTGLERQVIIRGFAQQISKKESEDYFFSRPKSSQIGAWASSQSSKIESREDLENQLAGFEEKFSKEELIKPPHWGGFAVVPSEIEFWQGRPNRLHDRILYSQRLGKWETTRLQP
jgi:pyridoxamine 5'-phosphate oxidase